jgi:hypothetical protein
MPSNYDPLFWRGNAWSVTLPGLPWLPGLTSSNFPDRCLTWFLGHPLWKDWIDRILTAHAERGYTHFTLSWPDANASCGQSQAQFVDLCAYVRSWGFDIECKLGSKDVNPPDQTWLGYWKDYIAPVTSALIQARAVQHVDIWEANAFNVPGRTFQDILLGIQGLTQWAGVYQWVHFSPGVTWWGAPDFLPNRFDWWDAQQGVLTGLLYQTNCADWDQGERQARIQDTTTRDANFMSGVFKFVAWENDASCGFDNAQPDERTSAADSYLLLCTPGNCAVSGFGNGCWLVDGTPTFNGNFR